MNALGGVLIAAFTVIAPPGKFDRPYQGKLIVRHGTTEQISRKCTVRGVMGHACAYIGLLSEGICTIWLPHVGQVAKDGTFITPWLYAEMKRHEVAHCAGWPIDHPQF